MIVKLIIGILFIIVAALSIIMKDRDDNASKIIFFSLGFVLILIAGMQPEGITKDYIEYLKGYTSITDFRSTRLEPTFVLIVKFVKATFNNPVFLFLIYAAIGVTLKFIAIKRLTSFYILSSLIYLSYFFILHEMTQIRAGIASGFLLLAIKPLYNRNLLQYLALVILASLFHYSAIILLPLWLLNSTKINKTIYLSSIVLSYFLAITGFSVGFLLELIPIKAINLLYEMHKLEMEAGVGQDINIFNSLQLFRVLLVFVLIYFIDLITEKNKYATLLLKIYIIGIVSFLLFSDIPVISFRISQLLNIVEVITIPFIAYLFKQRQFASIIPATIGVYMLWMSLFYINLIS
ncbi:MAG: EpsG family protein [Bacteroidota bacterium]